MQGGTQERGKRPGTENVLGIVGFGAAAREAVRISLGPSNEAEDLPRLVKAVSAPTGGTEGSSPQLHYAHQG